VFGQDEAGPYQTKPQPGAAWAPEGEPRRQPHEYLRDGTAKLLALFRPRTGELRAEAVTSAPNAVLHPWLQRELSAALALLPPLPPEAPYPELREWRTWLGHEPAEPLPPLRAILIWDNLAGHVSAGIVAWLFAQGVLPLYTPLSGSWLNMTESVQRIVCGRALNGTYPQTQDALLSFLDEAVAGWNAHPTPFVWGGMRYERRVRARERRRQRRLGGSGATVEQSQLIAA
jgi:DDE superfamily endonuclease